MGDMLQVAAVSAGISLFVIQLNSTWDLVMEDEPA
jgi:hypothetical protein